MRTSYSAIETYQQCPQKYKFQVIDKLKAPKSREAIFGTLIHETLKFMFEKSPLFPTLDEVISYFRANWPASDVLNKETRFDTMKFPWTEAEERAYFEEGVKMLKNFYEKNLPWNFAVLDLESRFEVALSDEKTGKTHILAGIIDRIDKNADGSYEIIDYKTSKRMPSQDRLDQNLQLSLYSLGLQKRWPHITPEEIKLSLYFLKHGEKLSTKPTAESTERTKEYMLKTISDIEERERTGKEFEPMPGPLCNWCGFKPYCPAWSHLYRKNDKLQITNDKMETVIKEYFAVKKQKKENDARIDELQGEIKAFMDKEGVTRVFGDDGFISKKVQQRYEYDFEALKSLLSPLGKWEEILKTDETKLKKIMREIPENIREKIENMRKVSREYTVLTASANKVKNPGETPEELVAN